MSLILGSGRVLVSSLRRGLVVGLAKAKVYSTADMVLVSGRVLLLLILCADI